MAARSSDRRRAPWPAVVLLAAALPLAPAALFAQPADRGRADALAERATERMRALQREADALAARARTLLVELRQLEIDRQMQVEALAQIEAELTGTARQIDEATELIATLEQEVAEQQPAIRARLVGLYTLGRAGYWRLLLGVDDARGLGRAYRAMATLARQDRVRMQRYRQTLDALASARATLEERAEKARGLRAEGRTRREALERAVAARSRLVRSIDERRDLNAQLTGELQVAQQQLQAALASLARGEAGPVPRLPLKPFRGDLPWPAPGRVTAGFGPDRNPRFDTTLIRNGIEVAGAEGAAVRAVHDGEVVFAEAFTGYGNLVIVDHGGDYSLYGHLGALEVEPGVRLDRGDRVGVVGRSPEGGPAFYFELRVDGRPVDPLEWLQPSPK